MSSGAVASYLGENVDFIVGDGFGLTESGKLHYKGELKVCNAENSNIGGIALPKNLSAALVKTETALNMFSNIFIELLPKLDRDLPFKDVPRYLMNHTGLCTLVACLGRAVSIGCAKEQFDCTSEKLSELNKFHCSGCDALIPILKRYI